MYEHRKKKITSIILLIAILVSNLPLIGRSQIEKDPPLELLDPTDPIPEYVNYPDKKMVLDEVSGTLEVKIDTKRETFISILDKTPETSIILSDIVHLYYDEYVSYIYENDKGVEWDIILSSVPTNNYWDFKIDGTDLNWFYQPAFDPNDYPKEYTVSDTHVYDENGTLLDHRPMDIVNSYAVFGNKKDNEYKTGKIMHVYRPLVVDANGDEVWGELSYQNNVLTLTVDDSWLENAVYPVRVDPTFGTTSIGGSSGGFQFHNTAYANNKILTENGTITSITAYLEYDNSRTVYAGLYNDSGATDPENLLSSGSTTVNGIDWFVFDITDINRTSGIYWLALGECSGYTATQKWYYDTVAAGNVTKYDSGATLPDPWVSAGQVANNRAYSIYANYTTIGGGPGPGPSPWSYPNTIDYTHGRLRVGNESLGQNPSFFYGNETDQLITLRQLQDAHLDRNDPGQYGYTYYTDTILDDWPGYTTGPFVNETWANATIQYAVAGGFNTLRIHIFLGKDQNDLFPTYKQINSTAFQNFLTHLSVAKNNSLYYALDGYFHDPYHPSWWLLDEMNQSSVIWNATVLDDFVYIWEAMVQEIYTNSSSYDGLLYIQPWSEWFLGGGASNILVTSRDPYRYDGSGANGNASLTSWNNWLDKEFSSNSTAMINAFDEGSSDKWNATTETAFFNASLSTGSWAGGSVRAYYCSRWYDECIYNFTSYFNTQLKTAFPGLYISWDGFASTYEGGGTADAVISAYTLIENSDVLDHHTFGSLVETYGYWGGDEVLNDYTQFSGLARALKIPIIVGEQGIVTGQSTGYAQSNDDETYEHWRQITNIMITQGYAGWTPYWCSYVHGYVSSQLYADDADRRLSTLAEINKEWEIAENYLDSIVYNNITVLTTLGDSYHSGSFDRMQLARGGYTPKYTIWSIGNGTRMPVSIPSDTEVLIIGGAYYPSREYFIDDLITINTWLGGDANRKLLIHYFATSDEHLNTIRYEDYINTAYFPINNMAYGAGYSLGENATDTYVTADGDQVLLNRSDNYHSQHGLTFNPPDITGDILVNITDSSKPYVIANNRIAWIAGSTEQFEALTASRAYNYDYDTWKIYKEIFDYWEIYPTVYANSDTREVSSYSSVASDHLMITIGNINQTSSETYSQRFNGTAWGLTGSFSLFDELAETRTDISTANLENIGYTTTLSQNNTNHIVIRNNTLPTYLFSVSYPVNETYTAVNETLRLDFTGYVNKTDVIYVYWPNVPTGNVDYGNGTTVLAIGFYNAGNALLTIPIDYSDIDMSVKIDGLRGAWNGTINGVTAPGSVDSILSTLILRINGVT